jgi:MFS transporter, PPP family, 3-phenylpropionic acid transporter
VNLGKTSPAAMWLGALLCAYFAFIGTHSPYLSLYFAAQGLEVAQIGILMTIPQVLRIVAPPFWGWMADRMARPVDLVRATLTVLVLACIGFFFIKGFYPWLALFTLMFFFSAAVGPITEALLLREVAGDTHGFGRIRVWGSIGFVIAVAIVGLLLDRFGLALLPWCMLFFALLTLSSALKMRSGALQLRERSRLSIGHILRRPGVLWFFASAFWMIFAHAALYTLYSLYLERLGISKSLIGLLWSIGVLAEIALFWWQRHLFARFTLAQLLGGSFVLAVLRFALIALAGPSLLLLGLAQLLHAATFAVHHSASMKYLHSTFEDAGVSRGMALYSTVAYGLGATAGGFFHAWLWEARGPVAIFWAASIACCIGALCAARVRLH